MLTAMLVGLVLSVALNVALLYRGLEWQERAMEVEGRLDRLRAQTRERAPFDTPFDPIDDYLWQGRRSAQENGILQKTPFKHWC